MFDAPALREVVLASGRFHDEIVAETGIPLRRFRGYLYGQHSGARHPEDVRAIAEFLRVGVDTITNVQVRHPRQPAPLDGRLRANRERRRRGAA